jgi:hypothetical protein
MADGQPNAAASKTRHTITQLLGAVRTDVELKGCPSDNNTRWVFDVESAAVAAGQDVIADKQEEIVCLYLLDPRSAKTVFRPDIFSCSFTPLCDAFYAARPYIEQREDGAFVLHMKRVGGLVRYRVGIDTIHSATR